MARRTRTTSTDPSWFAFEETDPRFRELKYRMKDTVVAFIYVKKDGEHRHALGTLNEDVIERYHDEHPATAGGRAAAVHSTPEHLFAYFDMEKGAWRCFAKSKYIGIDEDFGI